MEATKCPVCKGRGTVKEGFYRTGELDLKRPTCRSCDGKGYVALPGQQEPQPTYVPMPYPYPVYPSYPATPWYPRYWWDTTTAAPVIYGGSGTYCARPEGPFEIVSSGTSWANAYPPGSSASFTVS